MDNHKISHLKIGIIAGEASGDQLGAKLLDALKSSNIVVEARGIGGPAMNARGFQSLYDLEELAVMGLIAPLMRLPKLLKIRASIINYFRTFKPDLFIGIDAPDFNLSVEYALKKIGIPIVHYVSPSVWAWRQYRIKKIKRSIDLMLTLFPFESTIYKENDINVEYVGHPLAEQIPFTVDAKEARRSLCISEHAHYVAILPGSRKNEIKYLGPVFLKAAYALWRQRPDIKFLTSHINAQRYQEFYTLCKKLAPELPIQFFTRRSSDVIAASDVAIVTSGTVTLETMLYKKPMVIGYAMSGLTYAIAKRIVKTKCIGLPNLLAGQKIVPELIQDDLKPELAATYLLEFLEDNKKTAELINQYNTIHKKLKMDTGKIISNALMSVLK